MTGFLEKIKEGRQPTGKDVILASEALETYSDEIARQRQAALEEPKQR